MKYRTLGRTGIRVSEVGFGGWGIGGVSGGAVGYGPTNDRESVRALRRAIECGITFFDTADLYGFGHSERLIGAALNGVRREIVVATKVGFLGPDGPQDFSPPHIRASIDRSLQRLQSSYVDLYQLHNPPPGLFDQNSDAVETLEELVTAGKIRAWGISVKSPAEGVDVVRRIRPAAIQVNFNMIDQRALAVGLFGACVSAGVAVIGRTPLCSGYLSAKYLAQTAFDPRDHRARWPIEQRAQWAEAPDKFRSVLKASAPSTPAQMAIRFCLSYEAVSTVIPGMVTAQQVDENAASSDMGWLGSAERDEIERIYAAHEFFSSPPSSEPLHSVSTHPAQPPGRG